MGSTSWSDAVYSTRSAVRAASSTPTFEYDSHVKSGLVSEVHETLDSSKIKGGFREARDSSEHPESRPVAVFLDVTGSMLSVPVTIQSKLPSLMGLLIRQGFLSDPAILIGAIGDAKFDKYPMQVGQFESGIEIEDDLTNLILEGGGGGNMHESYELALYFLARMTQSDAWDKRGQKGYAFIICDEELSTTISAKELEKVFGVSGLQGDLKTSDIVEEVLEKWELYCIVPNLTSHFSDPRYKQNWKETLGERLILLDDPTAVSETIASLIGILEGNADIDSIASALTSEGATAGAAESVSRALSVVASGAVAKLQTGGTGLTAL